MITVETRDEKTFIEVKVTRAGLFIRAFLFFFTASPLLVILSFLAFAEKNGSPFALFLGLLVLGAISFYFLRLLLWNTYGKECHSIDGTEFVTFNDYGKYKDNRRVITGVTSLDFHYFLVGRPNEVFELTESNLEKAKRKEEFSLVLVVNGEALHSAVKLSIKDMEGFAKDMHLLPVPEPGRTQAEGT